MGKVRVAVMGDEQMEKKLRKKAEKRREAKRLKKKEKVKGVGLKGGERTVMVEGEELKPEVQEILDAKKDDAQPDDKKVVIKEKRKTRSSTYRKMRELVDRKKLYSLQDAILLIKKTSYSKFDGTVELHLNLNVLKKDQKKAIRGSVSLPHGIGKEVRVAIADDALLKKIEKKQIDFDILVAHPKMMPKLAKYAKLLGPRGLMPNPKTDTISDEPEARAKELSKGKSNYKSEPNNPIIHMPVGKVSFDDKKLVENIQAVLKAIGQNKIKKATLSATMGPGIKLELA